jgi:hypothetical protein
LYQLDFDQATLNGKKTRLLQGIGDGPADLMEAMILTPAMVGPIRRVALPRLVGRMDQQITYADMASTVAAIQDLVTRPDELRALLRQAGYPDVEAAVETLTERAPLLEPTLKRFFDGDELLRRGVASIRPLPNGWLARFRSRSLLRLVAMAGPARPVAAIRPVPAPMWNPEPLRMAA